MELNDTTETNADIFVSNSGSHSHKRRLQIASDRDQISLFIATHGPKSHRSIKLHLQGESSIEILAGCGVGRSRL
jgi:hypothetical protein